MVQNISRWERVDASSTLSPFLFGPMGLVTVDIEQKLLLLTWNSRFRLQTSLPCGTDGAMMHSGMSLDAM